MGRGEKYTAGDRRKKESRRPYPARFDVIQRASAAGRGAGNATMYGLRLANIQLKKKKVDRSEAQIHKCEIKSQASPLAAGAALVPMACDTCRWWGCAGAIAVTSAGNRGSFTASMEKSLAHSFI